jgi:hypothetical protein
LPGGEHGAGLIERGEQGLVQALVAQPPNEALGEGVLLRLAGGDVVPFDLCRLAP